MHMLNMKYQKCPCKCFILSIRLRKYHYCRAMSFYEHKISINARNVIPITNYRHVIMLTVRKIAVPSHFKDGKTAALFHNTDIKCLYSTKYSQAISFMDLKSYLTKYFCAI